MSLSFQKFLQNESKINKYINCFLGLASPTNVSLTGWAPFFLFFFFFLEITETYSFSIKVGHHLVDEWLKNIQKIAFEMIPYRNR